MRPGAGAGAAGVEDGYAARAGGTYYASEATRNNQAVAVRSNAYAYPVYSPAMYAGHAGAWVAPTTNNVSLYSNPGYGALAGSLGMAAQPQAYDYGSNVVTQPDGVYVNGENVGTPQQYAAQASQIASTGTEAPAADASWQPLGVFAFVQGNQTNSNDIFQIEVNSQGILRGNYHNLADNSVTPIEGAIDPKSQRAAWVIGSDQAPIYETGAANLTKDQAAILVHAADESVQQASLVRMPPPAADATNQGGAQPALP